MRNKTVFRITGARISLGVAQTRFLAGLFTNLAAGWLGVLFITPNFNGDLKLLTEDILSVILCSWLALKSEERLDEIKK